MALPVTMRRFAIALAHADREVYTELDLRVAQHPSESERYLVARVLARTLAAAEWAKTRRTEAARIIAAEVGIPEQGFQGRGRLRPPAARALGGFDPHWPALRR